MEQEEERVVDIDLDEPSDDSELIPPSDNEIDSPTHFTLPIPCPWDNDDSSDPESLQVEEEAEQQQQLVAPTQHPPHPMTLVSGLTEFDEDYFNGWEIIWNHDPGYEHGLPPFIGGRTSHVV